MKKAVCLKSTLRQPVRSLLLVLLCAAGVFGFLTQILQYTVLGNLTDDVGDYYNSVGTLEDIVPYVNDYMPGVPTPGNPQLYEAASIVRESPYLNYVDISRMEGGYMEGVYNGGAYSGYEGSYTVDHNASYVCAEFISATYDEGNFHTFTLDENRNTTMAYTSYIVTFEFEIKDVFVSLPELAPKGTETIYFFCDSEAEATRAIGAFTAGQCYFLCTRIWNSILLNGDEYRELYPLVDDSLLTMPLDEGEEPDLTLPELQSVAEDMALTDYNIHALSVNTATNSTIDPLFNEHYTLVEGRGLAKEDNDSANRVMLIRSELAELRDIELGDEITITMRDFIMPADSVLLECEYEQWYELDSCTETFTVVGIYTPLDQSAGATMEQNQCFIPDSCMPEGWRTAMSLPGSTLTFVLNSPLDQAAFERENSAALYDAGYVISFYDSGWDSFWNTIVPLQDSTRTSSVLFGGVLILALMLTVLLYLLFRRKELALLRAMGLSRSAALLQGALPFMLLGTLGTVAGGTAAWVYGMKKAEETLSGLGGDYDVVVWLSASQIILPALAAWLSLALLLIAGLLLVSSRPVLAQIQGGKRRR